jgi:hypothetical protein
VTLLAAALGMLPDFGFPAGVDWPRWIFDEMPMCGTPIYGTI